jgi:hypothetical protein
VPIIAKQTFSGATASQQNTNRRPKPSPPRNSLSICAIKPPTNEPSTKPQEASNHKSPKDQEVNWLRICFESQKRQQAAERRVAEAHILKKQEFAPKKEWRLTVARAVSPNFT